MKRQIYQNIGLIIALTIASVSLPIGIIGFLQEPTIINYYEQNYYYNNQTKPEAYFYPLEKYTYNNFTNSGFFHLRTFNMTENNIYFYHYNLSEVPSGSLRVVSVRDCFYELFLIDPLIYVYEDIWQGSQQFKQGVWNPPFKGIWHIAWISELPTTNLDITLYEEVINISS